MSLRSTPWPNGTACWVDLSSPDRDAAFSFYRAVLGWSFGEPNPDFNGYVLADVAGHDVAGIGSLDDGSPSVWTLYFASDDAEQTAKAIDQLGGRVLLPATEVAQLGTVLIAADPTGAVFGIWQAGEHIGAHCVRARGALAWNHLRTPDPDRAREFYEALFGLEGSGVADTPPDFVSLIEPESNESTAGIGAMPDEIGMPAHWLVCFGVDDVDLALDLAVGSGGSVVRRPIQTPFGRMAGLADPDGARFWVVVAPEPEPAGIPLDR